MFMIQIRIIAIGKFTHHNCFVIYLKINKIFQNNRIFRL